MLLTGLCGWYDRKPALEAYAAHKGVEIGDVDTQIEFLITEIKGSGPASDYASCAFLPSHGYTKKDWENATSPEDAATAFCWTFERPDEKYANLDRRKEAAKRYYDQFKGSDLGGSFEKGSTDSRIIGTFTSATSGKTFTIFNQMNITTKDGNWEEKCSRAAQISVCSGYYSGNPINLIDKVTSSAPEDSKLYNK